MPMMDMRIPIIGKPEVSQVARTLDWHNRDWSIISMTKKKSGSLLLGLQAESLRYDTGIRMDIDDRNPFLFGVIYRHPGSAPKRMVVIVYCQKTVGLGYQVLVPLAVIDRRGFVRFAYGDGCGTMLHQKRHPEFAPVVPVAVVVFKGQGDHQFNTAVIRLLFQLEQELSCPHIDSQAAAHPKLAHTIFIEQGALLPDLFLQTLAAAGIFFVFPFKSRWPMSSDGTTP